MPAVDGVPVMGGPDRESTAENWVTGLLTLVTVGVLPPAWYDLVWRYSDLAWPGNLAVLFVAIAVVWAAIFGMTLRRRRKGARAMDGIAALTIVGPEGLVVLSMCVLAVAHSW